MQEWALLKQFLSSAENGRKLMIFLVFKQLKNQLGKVLNIMIVQRLPTRVIYQSLFLFFLRYFYNNVRRALASGGLAACRFLMCIGDSVSAVGFRMLPMTLLTYSPSSFTSNTFGSHLNTSGQTIASSHLFTLQFKKKATTRFFQQQHSTYRH